MLPLVFLLIVALAALFAGTQLLHSDLKATAQTEVFFADPKGRALVISTGVGKDFPSAAGLEREDLKAELNALLDYAQQGEYSAVYFEAANQQSAFYRSRLLSAGWGEEKGLFFFDPLAYLCRQASLRGLEVYALTDMQSAGVCAELAAYPLSGVVLNSLGSPACSEDFLRQAADAMGQVSSQCRLGLVFEEKAVDRQVISALAQEKVLDLVHPIIAENTKGSEPLYEAALKEWGAAVENSSAKLVLWQPMEDIQSSEKQENLAFGLLMASMNKQVSGVVLGNVSALQKHPQAAETIIGHFAEGGQPPVIDLSFEQELKVYAPAEEIIWLDNSYTTYFLSGTSDPELPLTMNGKELERTSTNGVWGIQAELKTGKNTFTFAQQEKTVSVTIQVYNPNNATPNAISYITEGSRFPTSNRVFRSGQEVKFTCVAPSGSRVVAHIGGQNIVMTQRAATAMWGIPATFGASFTILSVDEDEVAALGGITYTLTLNGITTEYQSAGQLFAAGREANIVAEVGQYMTALYRSPNGDGNIAANLNPGTRLTLQGEYQNGRALLKDTELYVPLADVTILTGKQESQQYYDFFELRKTQKGEELVLGSGLNAPFPTYENGLLTVTFADTVVEGADNGLTIIHIEPTDLTKGSTDLPSGLFSDISVRNNEDGSASFVLQLQPGAALAGWDAYINEDGQAVLYCQAMPPLSHNYAKPLEGITVMVDPGHGGDDIGAPGAAGAGGPTEADVNLALAHMLRYRLQQLGATVVMTQQDNSRITIQERYLMAQRMRPDLYISVHHNSLAVHRDANEVFFTTAYYFYPQSAQLAQAAVQEVGRRTGRDMVDAAYAAYYVTRMTSAPSILFETGFVSNPLEQQQCCDSYTIYRTACGLADAILQTFERPYAKPIN
ncbi:MAG: N-acetylmuramoyl-L-alanine amidase [Oscillospiraceae bacterium]|nr:N-acetylmuramoyl-L-alanine amidase [Oscillospiraceae bacterium]